MSDGDVCLHYADPDTSPGNKQIALEQLQYRGIRCDAEYLRQLHNEENAQNTRNIAEFIMGIAKILAY